GEDVRGDEGEQPDEGERRRRSGTVAPRPLAYAPETADHEDEATQGAGPGCGGHREADDQ
ncbi:MAG: hypothetical protein JWN81_460, partial [Solirubrobacterales bacterium]|nr:hypothetical protein [Solirubrobacterales bacterium]